VPDGVHPDEPRAATPEPGPAPTLVGTAGAATHPKSLRRRRIVIWVVAGALAIAILIGLFFLGQRLGATPAPVPAPTRTQSATPTPAPTPAPTPPPQAVGPQPAGAHRWDELGGGECLQPYVSPWAEEFTVVDCAAQHAAQLVYRGVYPGGAATPFPGETALAAQINLLCSTPGVIDMTVAAGYPDLQLQGSYPVTEEQWVSGPRNYFCFVSRSTGALLSASVAGPGPGPRG
jgi:hypothetical protein